LFEVDIEMISYSLQHFSEELFEETFLSRAEPNLVKKPCEDFLVITQEYHKFRQIHKVEK